MVQTERLWLRPCGLDDVAVAHALWTEPQMRFFLFDNQIIAEAEARAFLEQSAHTFATHGYGIWLVGELEQARAIGFAGLLGDGVAAPNLLYGFAPAVWGRGYATEAARAVLSYALDELKLPEVRADVDAPNAASVRVLERIGMRRVSAPDAALLLYRS